MAKKVQTGDRVRLSESFKKAHLHGESGDHILEFCHAEGTVEDPCDIAGGDEFNVRWDSGLRYAYPPKALTIIKKAENQQDSMPEPTEIARKSYSFDTVLYSDGSTSMIRRNNGYSVAELLAVTVMVQNHLLKLIEANAKTDKTDVASQNSPLMNFN